MAQTNPVVTLRRPRALMVVWPRSARTETSAGENRLRCLAIVPAFNERAAIAAVIAELRALPWLDVVVIDDGSGDGTAAEAVRAGARVITLPFNLGIGTAVQTGYLIAQDARYDVAIQVDGDGQHPAERDRQRWSPRCRAARPTS